MAKRILIADDSVTIQKAFAMTFGAEDLTLTAARSADEGLTLARQTRPDLVIADANMPGRSGYELCAAIKADAGLRATPVFILASNQQPYDEAKGRQVGADGHLMKPWETTALIDRVRDVITQGARAEAAATAPTARPAAPASLPSGRAASSMPAAAMDDEYGEISVDAPRDTARDNARTAPMPIPSIANVPAAAAPPPAAHAPFGSHAPASPPRSTSSGMSTVHAPAAAPPGQSGVGMRPSLIPGVRPGAVPPARPGTNPVRPLGPAAGTVPPRPAASPVGRTLVGLPAANLPIPGSMRPGMPAAAPPIARAPTGPAVPLAAPPPRSPTGPAAPLATRAPTGPAPTVSSVVSSAVDQKIAAFAAKGPEYEALAKLSREVIEQIVWEIVPELAELIIREHMEKRGRI